LSVAIILLLAAIASSAGLLILQIGLWRNEEKYRQKKVAKNVSRNCQTRKSK